MQTNIQIESTQSPLGHIQLLLEDGKLAKLTIDTTNTDEITKREKTVLPVVFELKEYFSNPQHHFNIPLHLNGTAFQQRVWQALCKIPSGQTITYGELARLLKSSPRAIGQACRTNPIPIIIPCHRIIAANHLGGYAGQRSGEMMAIKIWLLNHEKTLRQREIEIS